MKETGVPSVNVHGAAQAAASPAKIIKDVREIKSRETGEQHYPWPNRFERGMPWENIGFENWEKENNI